MDHVRIDEGVKRGPRKARKKISKVAAFENEQRRQLQDATNGRFLTPYTPEQRQQAIQEALLAVEYGRESVEQVGQRLGVATSTLYAWLTGTDATERRTQFFDQLIVRAAHEIRSAESPLDLTRAREEVTAWIKVAERRDAKAWGIKQELTITVPEIALAFGRRPQLTDSTSGALQHDDDQ